MKTLLKNGTIVDGSGGKPYVSDVLIENDKITKIAKDIDAADAEVIDCTGLTVAPGFIDAHSHNDFFYDYDDAERFYEPFIRQGITSAQPLEGKTMTSINIAVTLALSGKRVALLEADMRRPTIFKALKVQAENGLSAVIEGTAKLKDVLKQTEVQGLQLIPCGTIPQNPAELFQTDGFAKLLADLKAQFDAIIIDSPPVTAVTDALIIENKHHTVVIAEFADSLPILCRGDFVVFEIPVVIRLGDKTRHIAVAGFVRFFKRLQIKPRHNHIVGNIFGQNAGIVHLLCPLEVAVIEAL